MFYFFDILFVSLQNSVLPFKGSLGKLEYIGVCQATCEFQMCAEWSFDGRAGHLVCFGPSWDNSHLSPRFCTIFLAAAVNPILPALQLSSHYSCQRAHTILTPRPAILTHAGKGAVCVDSA